MTFTPDDDDRLWRETQQESWFRFSTPIRYIILLIILVFLIICVWYLFNFTNKSYNKVDIPLIKAEETPSKVKAEDQGVPGIKHQDKLVYGRIRGDEGTPPVEHILPDPETPTVKMVEQYKPNDGELEKGAEPDPKGEGNISSSISSISDLIPEEDPGKKQQPEKKMGKGTVFVQLGSLKSYDLAESEWARLSNKHKDVFANLKPTIQKVDLGEEKGIYYRLRTGYETSEQATTACSTLKERKVECLVIH
ncbi:MAG: SPOR domain-containing protein [Alphaproteobacteria bacterium]|nr:SPOR domain-containing protein [Alphaproteobacteria bacterium]